jgi:hypothetical protein
MFGALIRCIQFLKRPTNVHEYMNVILSLSNHQHVSVTLMAIVISVRTRIWFQLQCFRTNPHLKNHIILVKFMVNRVRIERYKILEDKMLLCMVYTAVYGVYCCGWCILLWVVYTEDTYSELRPRWLSSDINSTMNRYEVVPGWSLCSCRFLIRKLI